jgi:hypothetical protein
MIFIFLGLFGIYGFKIGMGYVDQSAIRGAVKNALIEAKAHETYREKDITNSILTQSQVGTYQIDKSDISVTANGNHTFSVEINHIKEIGITDKIKLIMDLGFIEESK